MMSEQPAIEADGVVKRFGVRAVLHSVDLHVPCGAVVGLLGPNGAGKTTMVRILTTQLRADRGRIRIHGRDIARDAGGVRRLIGLSGQFAAVDAYLTGRENIVMIGRLAGLSRRDAHARATELLDAFDLHDEAHRQVRRYSGGTRRRLDVAASLVARPRVLFLDEPTTGLDPRGRLRLWQLLEGLRNHGTTIVLTTQYLEEADRLTDTVVVLDRGRVIASGSPEQLKAEIGGDRLELHVPPGAQTEPFVTALAGLGSSPATVDATTGRVVMPVSDGASVLEEVAARLGVAELRVAELALRRPSLDDVFLTLTGAGAGQAPEEVVR
jgi:ABC-2 type transport system ATP-binding protein